MNQSTIKESTGTTLFKISSTEKPELFLLSNNQFEIKGPDTGLDYKKINSIETIPEFNREKICEEIFEAIEIGKHLNYLLNNDNVNFENEEILDRFETFCHIMEDRIVKARKYIFDQSLRVSWLKREIRE